MLFCFFQLAKDDAFTAIFVAGIIVWIFFIVTAISLILVLLRLFAKTIHLRPTFIYLFAGILTAGLSLGALILLADGDADIYGYISVAAGLLLSIYILRDAYLYNRSN
jgi:hypothetical protein